MRIYRVHPGLVATTWALALFTCGLWPRAHASFEPTESTAGTALDDLAAQLGASLWIASDAREQLQPSRLRSMPEDLTPPEAVAWLAKTLKLDIVWLDDRLCVHASGRTPAAWLLLDRLAASATAPAQPPRPQRHAQCHWQDISIDRLCKEFPVLFGAPIRVAPLIRNEQRVVFLNGDRISLDEALFEIARQLDCPYAWNNGTVVFDRAATPAARTPDAGGDRGESGNAEEARAGAPCDVNAPLRLTGKLAKWPDLIRTVLRSTRCLVSPPQDWSDVQLNPLWADGAAADILTVAAWWSDDSVDVVVAHGNIRLLRAAPSRQR